MAGDDDRDSRRKHRRSNSSDDEDAAEKSSSSKRHKHRHHHRHHRHRHSSKRREEEEGKVSAEEIEALPPPPPPPQDVEEGEILDDSGVRDDAVLKTEGADDSSAESGEIEEARDRSDKPNPGIYGDGIDDIRSPVGPKSLNEARDSSVHANGNLDMKRHRESGSPSNRSDRRKKYSDDEKLDVDRSKGKSSHWSSGDKDEFHRRSRSRSSNDRVRERSPSRSIMEDEAITKRRCYNERETYAEKSKAAHSDDERMVRDGEREHSYSRYSGLDRNREREKSREREVDRVRRKEKELERNRGRDPRRENERERSSDRDLVRDRKRVTDWESRREERHRSRDRDNRDRREDETDKNRDRTKVSDRDRVMDRHRDRDRVTDQKWETRDDRYRDKGRDKYENLEDRYRNRDRNNHSARSRHDGKEHKQEGSAKSDPEKDQLKRDEDEEEDNEETMVPLQSADQEEEDLNRIKEESRRRKQAILEKYKSLQSQSQSQQEPQLQVQQQIDSENDHGGQSTEAASRAEITNGKSNGEVNVAESSLPTTTGQNGTMRLGEGTPKSETPDGLDKTKERLDGILCDDIFGETPTGVRKSGKGDALRIERSGLRDNWDDADGYYSYRFGELLDGRYEITAAHGKGVFSTVVRAKNLKVGNGEPEEVAIKIIRSNDTMYKAGMTELAILKKLVGQDPDNKRYCVRFLSSFKYRNHLCLVFESLHMNLRELLKKFGRNIGLKLTAVRIYAKQLLVALKHLKNCGVLHCDIKPDNMLVNEAKNVLKLCDFGNAMFAGKNEVTPYLVSRFYRAPEIILGLPYDHPLDIWSVGCCLFELYTGKVLFPGATNNDMLRLHMELKGPFPKKMLRKGAFTCQNFDQDLNFHATEDDPVTKKTIKRVILNIKPKDIGSMIAGSPGEDPDPKILADFKDLLDKMFVLDPDKRLTVSQGLNHPFITGK